MGAATDLPSEGVRRLLSMQRSGAFGLEQEIKPDLDVALVGDFKPTEYGFGGHRKGLKPADLK